MSEKEQEREGKKLLAKAEIFDNGDDTYQFVAAVKLGEFELKIDKTVDTRTDAQKSRKERHLQTVE